VNALRALPPQKYHVVFAAGNPQAREFATQLQTLLNSAGWTSSGMQPIQDAPNRVISIGVPQQSAAAQAVVNWAARGGLNPDYRVFPRLQEIRIIVGTVKQ
jgi:hypothetical protein